jgi:hypothetical protein
LKGYEPEIFSEDSLPSTPNLLLWDLDTHTQSSLEKYTPKIPNAACDVIVDVMGSAYMKSKQVRIRVKNVFFICKVSPDALTHVALHIALLKYYGTTRYFLETVDARHYSNARYYKELSYFDTMQITNFTDIYTRTTIIFRGVPSRKYRSVTENADRSL